LILFAYHPTPLALASPELIRSQRMTVPLNQHRWIGRHYSLASVFGWALAIRVIAAGVIQWYTQRKGWLCVFPDTEIYWGLASKLHRGEPYEVLDWGEIPRFAVRTPGYPLFLATCQFAFGSRVFPVRLVQSFLGASCVLLVARLTQRALPEARSNDRTRWSIPLIAATITALDPFVVLNSAFLLSEALFLPLMLLAQWGLASLWSAEERPWTRAFWALLTGAAWGASILVRPAWALYPPAVLLAFLILDRRYWRSAILVVVGIVIIMMPWWIRNERIYGRFVPTALWTGASLYDGLNPRATGSSDMSFLGDPEFWPLDEETQDAVLRDRAVAFARENPGRALWLAVIKAGRFWSPWPNALSVRTLGIAIASALVTLPLFALTAIGLWECRRDLRGLVLLASPLVYTFLLHLVFVSSMRYRVPVEVPAAGLAAVGLQAIFHARNACRTTAPM
jgi:4-amino-4-deoxy-L-arabinose transferase-like glycosyltransferase